MIPLLAQLNAQIASSEPRKPKCKWCRGKGELGSGRECNHCDGPGSEPERDDDLDMED